MMTELDYTESSFDAAHKGEYAQQIHGHTWFVRIFWPASPPKDARFMHSRLRQYLEAAFDHRMLDDVIEDPTNIGVARAIWQLMGDDLQRIQVWRGGACPCGATIER
jgi:6-pyruvoyl-tetrahydropterin synthase